MASFYHVGALAAASTLLAGCAVYAPTVPSTPLLEAKQVEVTASLRGVTALEASAAWSPVPPVLLLGEAALQGSNSQTTTINNVTTSYQDYHRQAGLGVGVYRAPTSPLGWYVAALGGLGFAKVNLHSVDVGVVSPYVPLPFPYTVGFYEARYRRYYGQVYAAQTLSERLAMGFSLRGAYVHYTDIAFEGQAITPANHVFIEPTCFLRFGQGPVRGQATIGMSVPTGREASRELSQRTAPLSWLCSLGLVFRPDLIGGRQKD